MNPPAPPTGLDRRSGLRYGALGFGLAALALPLHVHLPAFYAESQGLPLTALGLLLLACRALDALLDPRIGRIADRWLDAGSGALLWRLALSAGLLAAAFFALFHPPRLGPQALLAWCAGSLLLCYLSYSLLTVVHQAWGARLAGGALHQARLNAWREGMALLGVLCAGVLPTLAGYDALAALLALALALGLLLLARAPRALPRPAPTAAQPWQIGQGWQVWQVAGFRRLLLVFLLNGMAAAVPATLLMFFVADRLQTPSAAPLYLLLYFGAAAAALPFWPRLVGRLGPVPSWGLGMALALVCFAGAGLLGAGDRLAFALVCLGSGMALGADLAIPGALLTRVIQQAGLGGRAEGAFFGWWNGAAKLSLALAAGLALPALDLLGYAPGRRDAASLQALTLAYALLPCLLKLAAGAALYRLLLRPQRQRSATETPPCPQI